MRARQWPPAAAAPRGVGLVDRVCAQRAIALYVLGGRKVVGRNRHGKRRIRGQYAGIDSKLQLVVVRI